MAQVRCMELRYFPRVGCVCSSFFCSRSCRWDRSCSWLISSPYSWRPSDRQTPRGMAAYLPTVQQLIATVDHRQATAAQARFWIEQRLKQVSWRKEKGKRFACLNWRERIKNYCKGASSNVPANRSISIRWSGPSFCAAFVKALIIPNRFASGSTR